MKTNSFVFALFSIVILGCSSTKKITIATANDTEDLVGLITKEQFSTAPYKLWFEPNYNNYKLNSSVIDKLKPLLKNVSIKAFMGTWCGDSQDQTPVFYKILDETNFNYKQLQLVGVGHNKSTPDNAQEGYDIQRVPTFIFYKNSKEIGRFVEYPRETIEKDILKILSNQGYKHSYQE
ncbi:MAG: thioredoxin family protein [Lutibacter sp.]|nr:thioredoxin family protein [Lutibacter sp.]